MVLLGFPILLLLLLLGFFFCSSVCPWSSSAFPSSFFFFSSASFSAAALSAAAFSAAGFSSVPPFSFVASSLGTVSAVFACSAVLASQQVSSVRVPLIFSGSPFSTKPSLHSYDL